MNSNKEDGDNQLPIADSCALTSSDDEVEQSDVVIFQKKHARLFSKVSCWNENKVKKKGPAHEIS